MTLLPRTLWLPAFTQQPALLPLAHLHQLLKSLLMRPSVTCSASARCLSRRLARTPPARPMRASLAALSGDRDLPPALPSLPSWPLGEPSSPPRRAQSLVYGTAAGAPRPVVQGLPSGNTPAPASTLHLLSHTALQPLAMVMSSLHPSTLGGSSDPLDSASSSEPRDPASTSQSGPGQSDQPGVG